MRRNFIDRHCMCHITGDGEDVHGQTGGVYCPVILDTFHLSFYSFWTATQNSASKTEADTIPFSTLYFTSPKKLDT
jgi:hypothetical protein